MRRLNKWYPSRGNVGGGEQEPEPFDRALGAARQGIIARVLSVLMDTCAVSWLQNLGSPSWDVGGRARPELRDGRAAYL